MTLQLISTGDRLTATQWMNNYNDCLVHVGTNTIRQLMDRSIVFSKGYIDGWGEAYIDATGRLDSVSIVSSLTSASFVTNQYLVSTSVTSSVQIYHTIPTGTFNTTISKTIGVPLYSAYNANGTVQYKLINTTEDTGWLSPNQITSFTMFSSSPTALIVKLLNTSTSNLGLYGFWVRAT